MGASNGSSYERRSPSAASRFLARRRRERERTVLHGSPSFWSSRIEHASGPGCTISSGAGSELSSLAFNLRRFYPLPENDAWWGEVTEATCRGGSALRQRLGRVG